MKNFTLDLWNAFKSKLIVLTLLMTIVGAMEGVGLVLFLPFITLLSGNASTSSTTVWVTPILLNTVSPAFHIIFLALIIVSIFTCQLMVSMVQGKLIAQLESEYVDIWRRKLLTAILETRWAFFMENKAGDLLFHFNTETERLGRAFLLAAQVASTLILLAIYLLIAFYLSWQFSLLLCLVGLAGFVLITRSFAKQAYKTGTSYAVNNNHLLAYVSEFIQAAKMIKVTSSEHRVMGICDKLLTTLKQDYFGAVFYSYALRNILEFFIIVGICLSLVLLHSFGVAFASIIILMAVCLRIFPKIHTLQSSYQLLLGYLPSFDNLSAKLHAAMIAAEKNGEGLVQNRPNKSPPSIQFSGICFSYGNVVALEDINFEIQSGKICAIVGPSGAGKSSLVDLIVKISPPNAGRILIDEINLQTLETSAWRHSIGYVTQESLLLHDTILQNIRWGSSSVTEEAVIEACRLANAHDFILKLDQGYQTMIGEKGGKLSGGQRQRLALARALVAKPSLLILDEATSALDTESEQAVINTLNALRGKLTIILISHRTAPVHIADQVLHLQAGKVIQVNDIPALMINESNL